MATLQRYTSTMATYPESAVEMARIKEESTGGRKGKLRDYSLRLVLDYDIYR